MFDTHCHINLIGGSAADQDRTVTDAVSAGVRLMVNVGVDAATSLESRDLAERHPEVLFTAGFHPEIFNEDRGLVYDETLLENLCRHPRFAAVGEIGLDYFHNKENSSEQIGLFERQLEFAASRKLTVVLHTRDSWNDTFAALDRFRGRSLRGIFHCFSADYSTAVRCLDLGFLVSFAGTLTYKNAAGLRDAAVRLPADRILLETDSPYLTPVPRRGERNQPAYIRHLYEFYASLTARSIGEISETHEKTLTALWGRPGSAEPLIPDGATDR